MSEKWLTVAEAAKHLARPKPTIANWAKRKVIKTRKDKKPNGLTRLMVELESVTKQNQESWQRNRQHLELDRASQLEELTCPQCGHGDLHRKGISHLVNGQTSLTLKCLGCEHRFKARLPPGVDVRTIRRQSRQRGSNVTGQPDSHQRVVADQQRWVQQFIEEGLTLKQVLAVFGPKMHSRITQFYHQAESGDGHPSNPRQSTTS